MRLRNLALLPIAITLAVGLVACGAEPQADPTGEPSATPTPSAEATEAPVAQQFAMPDDCLSILPTERQQSFASQNLDLLGGPGGKFEHYYADPTPEERAGGISCIWGDENVPESTITVSVAPISTATRGAIVEDLIEQGLNEATIDGGGISYAQLGDQNSAPAILNIIRDDSWISVIEALGGEAFFGEAVELAGEVAEQVYTP